MRSAWNTRRRQRSRSSRVRRGKAARTAAARALVLSKRRPARASASRRAFGSSAFSASREARASGGILSSRAEAGLAGLGGHAHAQRPFVFHRKPPRRVVELHRGDAKVDDNEIDARQFRPGEDLGEAGEIGAMGGESLRAEAEEAWAGL